MKKRKTNAIIDKVSGEAFISIDTIIEVTKMISKFCVNDFTNARNEWIQEKLDSGEDIDVRFERDYTKKVAKNMKVLGDTITDHFVTKKKEYKKGK